MEVISIENICIENIITTPEHPYRIIVVYPKEFRSDPIFQNNRGHLIGNFYKWLDLKKQCEGEKSILPFLNFDSQIDKQKKIIENISNQINDIENNMNKGLSPYRWIVLKNIDECDSNGWRIKADYGLNLVR